MQPVDGTPDGTHVWLLLWKCYSAVRRYAEADIATLGLSLTDFGILEALLHKGPMPVNDLGRTVGLTSGSITTAVDRLQARKLLERRDSEEDARARVVHLTALGRNDIQCAFRAHSKAMDRLGATLTAPERRQFAGLLRKLGFAAAEAAREPSRMHAPVAERTSRRPGAPLSASRSGGRRE
jgi:MarR family transcriptional regulator, 2-MHQ and catechol-resistance regulon repressor